MTAPSQDPVESAGPASAGLPKAPTAAEDTLRDAGIDPDRLSIAFLGEPVSQPRAVPAPWAIRLGIGFALWGLFYLLQHHGYEIPHWINAGAALIIGMVRTTSPVRSSPLSSAWLCR